MHGVQQQLAESRGKIEALKSVDIAKQLRTAQQDAESLQDERDSLRVQLSLAQEAEQRAQAQLKEGNSESRKLNKEIEQMKQELQNNEEMWKEKVEELEKVCCNMSYSADLYVVMSLFLLLCCRK